MTLSNSSKFQSLKIEIIKEFFSHHIIKVNTEEYFTLSSGLKLPIYLDHRLIFSFPSLREKVIKAWLMLIQDFLSKHISVKDNENIVFAGTATAGIAPAYALSSHSNTGFIYVRDKSKAHGLKSQIEGFCTNDNQFIVVDDMVVTAGSILKSTQVLQDLYGIQNILCATSISCHESSKMRSIFKENNVHYFSLFTTFEIFDIAYNAHVINKHEYDAVVPCLKKLFDQK